MKHIMILYLSACLYLLLHLEAVLAQVTMQRFSIKQFLEDAEQRHWVKVSEAAKAEGVTWEEIERRWETFKEHRQQLDAEAEAEAEAEEHAQKQKLQEEQQLKQKQQEEQQQKQNHLVQKELQRPCYSKASHGPYCGPIFL